MRAPKKPQGNGPDAEFMMAVWEEVWGGGRLIDSPGMVINRTTKGTSILLKALTIASATSTPSTTSIYKYQKSYGDYIIAKDANGTPVQIAKQPENRNRIVTRTFYNATWTYTYPHNPGDHTSSSWNIATADPLAFLYRIASNPDSGSFREGLSPPYALNDEVLAESGVTTGVVSVLPDATTPVGTPITIQEKTNRAWSVFADQQFGV